MDKDKKNFTSTERFLQETESCKDSAWLKQLVVRHSVMNKRDLLDNEKYERRGVYLNLINEIQNTGRFI